MKGNKFKTKKFWEKWQLTAGEYQQILQLLKREPNELELSMFAVMWSEHCSYKNTRHLLKILPTKADFVIQGPGENAGIIDIGEEEFVVMKMESHNHPSAIEPFQGAATGVGGILRDIFTMGARPIALLDSLFFGNYDDNRTRYLCAGVVGGISFYGNCVGVPTVGGETIFSESYQGNILVNVMSVGLVKKGHIINAIAKGAGNSVILIGAKTGRDGIGGAAFASVELSNKSEEDRPAVQIGDPFSEKLLIEACLELVKLKEIIGMQDCGAAGLTSSLSEMASRGNCGLEIDLSQVPQREAGMNPFEIMLSESQERMIVVVEKGKEESVFNILEKWDLDSALIGKVIKEKKFIIKDDKKILANIPVKALTEGVPVIQRTIKEPVWQKNLNRFDIGEIKEAEEYNDILLQMLASPNIFCKKNIFQQYDHTVQINTLIPPGDDAAVLRIKGSRKAIALTTEGNGRYCLLDPFIGAQIAVAEAARNISCKGAFPKAVTDCLNFGAPENSDSYWQLVQAIKGLAKACKFFNTPVISGNVSLYNENNGKPIDPTPVVGMVGVLDNYKNICTLDFKSENDIIFLLGENKNEMGGSEYLAFIHGIRKGIPPFLDLQIEKKVQSACRRLISKGLLTSAHDCAIGGLAIALAESCITGGKGATIDINTDFRPDCLLFGESQSRIIVSAKPEKVQEIINIAQEEKIPFQQIGMVGGDSLKINKLINIPLTKLEKIWNKQDETR